MPSPKIAVFEPEPQSAMVTIKGSCACGALTYEVNAEPPFMKALCHCHNCQALSGTAFTTNVLIPRTSFKLTAGEPKFYTFTQEPSKIDFKTTFCGNCGGRLAKQTEDEAFKDVLILQAGTAQGNPFAGAPELELWVPHKQTWLEPVDGAAQLQGFA